MPTTDRKDEIVRIDLTPAQAEQVRTQTGIQANAIEMTVHELEERVAPRLALNSNETMLTP